MWYKLRDDIHCCVDSGVIVFLDLRSHRYFSLSGREFELFSQLTTIEPGGIWPEALEQYAMRLNQLGILSKSNTSVSSILPTPNIPADSSLLDEDHCDCKLPGLRSFFAMVIAIAEASYLLRQKDLIKVAARIRAWRRHVPNRQPKSQPRLEEHVQSFFQMAPFFFTLENKCLSRSLILVRYLSILNLSSRWIIGVHYDPFAAHCWVEKDGKVLNEHLDNVLKYKKILIV